MTDKTTKCTGLVVLDGPDCCGKTTLADFLCVELGGKYLHCRGTRFNDMFNYQTEVLLEAVRACDQQLVVIDRFWPSEVVYGNVFRGGSKFMHNPRLLDRVVRKHGGVYVFCLPEGYDRGDFSSALARHQRHVDPSHPYRDEDLRKVHQGYVDLFKESFLDRPDVLLYHLETHGADISRFCRQVRLKLVAHQARTFQVMLSHSYQGGLGHPYMSTHVLVGDQVNQKEHPVEWPFFEHGNCSAFLCKALDLAKVPDHSLMFFNACDGDPRTRPILESLYHDHALQLVALGKRAYGKLLEFDFTPDQLRLVAHPQFARRFHYHDGTYANILKHSLRKEN